MPGGHSLFGTRASASPGLYPPYPDGSADFTAGGSFTLLSGATLPLSPTAGWSVAWWFRQDIPGAGGTSFYVWDQLHLGTGLATAGSGDQVRCAFESGLGVYRTVTGAADGSFSSPGSDGDPFGGWLFVVEVYDPTTFPPNPTTRRSIGGNAFSGTTSMTALAQTAVGGTTWRIAQGPAIAGWAPWSLGRIDAMTVWNGPLTLADAQTLYNGGQGCDLPRQLPGSISQPLIAWWPLDEPSGATIWRDASGNSHHLSAVGTVNHGAPRNH